MVAVRLLSLLGPPRLLALPADGESPAAALPRHEAPASFSLYVCKREAYELALRPCRSGRSALEQAEL